MDDAAASLVVHHVRAERTAPPASRPLHPTTTQEESRQRKMSRARMSECRVRAAKKQDTTAYGNTIVSLTVKHHHYLISRMLLSYTTIQSINYHPPLVAGTALQVLGWNFDRA